MWEKSLVLAGAFAALLSFGAAASSGDKPPGREAYDNGDFTTAMTVMMPLARNGDASAQFDVGTMYDFGLGVAADRTEAARWYRRAADQGDATAQYNLAVMYEEGTGVEKDLVTAYVYYALAARGIAPEYARRNQAAVRAQLSSDQLAQAEQRVAAFQAKVERPSATAPTAPVAPSAPADPAAPAQPELAPIAPPATANP
ncbi:tetratricopeptide repeat protein [Zavarzinia sp. CC-PAN008]|uniref:tetratricopeptide repeat protein n=1 Tax=Zavarzinia sp. CC-PAN008 TaxID=3243332 RepID=UPI003F744A6F